MDNITWLVCVIATFILWSATVMLYKAGIHKDPEEHTCLKYSASIGIIFFVIALVYLLIRDEPFTIWESAVRFWPITLFGIVYAIVNTISFNGFIYNEVTVESPIERISGGVSAILLIFVYAAMGRVDSALTLLTPFRTAGIVVIVISVVALSTIRNRDARSDAAGAEGADGTGSAGGKQPGSKSRWKYLGLGTLIFPVMYAVLDGLETIITGICLDSTYGFAMPEGDAVIIVGMEYAVFALGCYIYLYWKEGKVYNPFKRENAPRILGALTDNVGIVFYTYAMAINSVSTDPILAVYPVLVMIGGRLFMKEKVSTKQYLCLLGAIVGSVLVIVDTLA